MVTSRTYVVTEAIERCGKGSASSKTHLRDAVPQSATGQEAVAGGRVVQGYGSIVHIFATTIGLGMIVALASPSPGGSGGRNDTA